MATIQLTIPDNLVAEMDSIAQSQGYSDLQGLLRNTLRSLLVRSRLERNAPSVSAQVRQELP